jgi:hypothetical protein
MSGTTLDGEKTVSRPRSGRNDDVRRQRLLAHMRNGQGAPVLDNMDPRMRQRMEFETQQWEQRQARKTQTGPTDTPPPSTSKDQPYETRAQELKRKQEAIAAMAKQERDAATEKTLAGLSDPECIETIRGILAEHEQKKSEEAAVFKDYDFVADLDRAPAEKRKTDFVAIIDTIEAVSDRGTRLDSALGTARSKVPNPTPEQQKALDDASRLKGILTEHIPDEFWKERFTLPHRRELITASDEDKKRILAKEKEGFPEGEGFTQRFKEIIEPHSTKDFERTSFYFDRFVSGPPAKELNELGVMTSKIIAKAYRIRDAGGSLKDVEEMMASTGLPEDWWPPNFIQSLQAWRKCEREMLRKKATELCEKNDYDFSSPSDIVKYIKDQAYQTGSSAKQMFAEILETGEVKQAVGEFTNQLKSNFGLGEDVANALESGEFGNLDPSVAKQLFDSIVGAETKLSGVLSTAVSGLKQTAKLPDHVQTVTKTLGHHAQVVTGALSDHSAEIAEVAKLAGSFVPGLALAIASLNLGLALAELAKQSVMLGVAVSAADESIGRVARGELEDGFALTYALQNEQKARGMAVGKATVKTVTAGLSLTGAAAEVGGAHFGVAAKYGLMVTGKVITYGSKIVFNGIEWGQANSAKELIAQARAGNPVARIELFKDSATYAKLYIAILAREGDSTAVDFVEKNGIDETTIANKANAIWILEKALRADSGQKADEEVPDSLADALTGGIFSKIKSVGQKAISIPGKIQDGIHDLAKGDERKQAYDKNWRYNGSADISATTWRSAKDEAYKAGLHDDHGTGMSSAVAAAEKAYNAATTLLNSGKASDDPAATRKILLDAISALQALQQMAFQWTPMSNKDENDHQEIHAGMTEFVVRLRNTAIRSANELDQELKDLGIKNTNFQAAISSEPLDDKVWATNWKGGIEKACLPKNDGGVQDALKTAMKCIAKRDETDRSKDPQDWRKACLALKDALDQVLIATEACRGPASEVPSLAAALERMRTAAATRLREMDREMASDWPNMPQKPTVVSAAEWAKFYESACAGGAAKRGEGGDIAKALRTLEEMEKTIAKKADNPQKQLQAEMAYREATGNLMLATAEFMRSQREAAEPLKEYVFAIGAFAQSEQASKANTQQGRTFTPRPNLTVAAWEETYGNAVAAGAVLANGDIKSSISKALSAYVKVQEELDKLRTAKTYKKIRGAANDVLQALGKLAAAVSQAMGDRGFKDNTIMSQYLAQRLDRIRKLTADETLRNDADGMAAPAGDFKPESPVWATKGWDKAKKDAVATGIIVDADTGMTPALKAAVEAFDKFRKQKDKAKTPKQQDELKKLQADAREKVTALQTFVTGTLKLLSKHAGWLAYVEAWNRLCDNTLNSADLRLP